MSEFTDAIRQALGERVSVLEAENRRLREAALAHPPIGTRYRDEHGKVMAVVVPTEITSESGHKAAMIGEFEETTVFQCEQCEQCEGDCADAVDDLELCSACDGAGEYSFSLPVSWITIKEIHRAVIAALPEPE